MKSARGGRPLVTDAALVSGAGAPRQSTPLRIAHVWTIERGIVRIPLDEFPRALMVGSFVYEAKVDARGVPLVHCGQRTNVEFCDYRRRRPIRSDDFPVHYPPLEYDVVLEKDRRRSRRST